ncbi:MAG: MFS transporter [Acidimicrobiales bacterium]
MTTVAFDARKRRGLDVLWNRQLDRYPDTAPRIVFLAIVVVATILLYYELYVPGAVAPQILQHYGMSFRYYVYIAVIGNALGAFASIIAGLADRWGRANLVAWGLGVTAALVLFAWPHAPNQFWFAFIQILISFVEGIILVATPALVRDFSPQLGRASAMGFWTLGPVIGSLLVAEIASNTLGTSVTFHDAQGQFYICGIVGLVVFVIALFGLRELSPNLRDQLMVSMRDRALIEAKAKGLDVESALKNPWRQMLHADVVGSAFAVSVMLLIYYAIVGFYNIYLETIFGFTAKQANGIGNWFWAFDALMLVVVGFLSDRIRVRKPFMVVGALGAAVSTVFFLQKATQPHTSYYSMVLVTTILALFLAIAYAPWMASFTETVERRNPALTATGLAVWGWIIRIVVSLSALILPFVISSMTPLVTYGAQVSALAHKYPALIEVGTYVDPATQQALSAGNLAPLGKALSELESGMHVSSSQALNLLLQAKAAPASAKAFLSAHGPAVANALKKTPSQWKDWWYVCLGGEIVFLPFILLMVGRWSPRAAKRDADDHERLVAEEMGRLGMSAPATAGAD